MNKTYEQIIDEMLERESSEIKRLTPSSDIDKKHCKICGEMKVRIHNGSYDSRNKRFVDESGKQWNGRVCPDCHANKSKSNMRVLRKKNEKGSKNI